MNSTIRSSCVSNQGRIADECTRAGLEEQPSDLLSFATTTLESVGPIDRVWAGRPRVLDIELLTEIRASLQRPGPSGPEPPLDVMEAKHPWRYR
jgi:hypothetical protein